MNRFCFLNRFYRRYFCVTSKIFNDSCNISRSVPNTETFRQFPKLEKLLPYQQYVLESQCLFGLLETTQGTPYLLKSMTPLPSSTLLVHCVQFDPMLFFGSISKGMCSLLVRSLHLTTVGQLGPYWLAVLFP